MMSENGNQQIKPLTGEAKDGVANDSVQGARNLHNYQIRRLKPRIPLNKFPNKSIIIPIIIPVQ
jgi:hypothetical protein